MEETQVAPQNLRNTVYQTNKILKEISLSLQVGAVWPLILTWIFLWMFKLFERDPLVPWISIGGFLEGFCVKDDEDFDQWAS